MIWKFSSIFFKHLTLTWTKDGLGLAHFCEFTLFLYKMYL